MQHGRFINGGYYLHKIMGNFVGHMSAWFDKDGNMLDAEQITLPFIPSRNVKRNGPMWRYAQDIGQRYRHIPAK